MAKPKKNNDKKKILGLPIGLIVSLLLGLSLVGGVAVYASNNPVPGTSGKNKIIQGIEWTGEKLNEFGNWVGGKFAGLQKEDDKEYYNLIKNLKSKKSLSFKEKGELEAAGRRYNFQRKKGQSYQGYMDDLLSKISGSQKTNISKEKQRLNTAGRMDRQNKLKASADKEYVSKLQSLVASMPASEKEKIQNYLNRHGKTKDEYEAALKKYAQGKYADKFKKLQKENRQDLEDANQGAKKTTKKDAEKQLKDGTVNPTSFWGKVGKALLNVFWSSKVGEWLKSNGAGSQIFAGVTDGNESQITSNPIVLIYPANTYYSTMSQISDILQPAMIALGTVLITLALIISSIRMGWGQALDPIRSRLQWYQNIIDTLIAVAGVAAFPSFVNMILQLDGSILLAFKHLLANIKPLDGSNGTLFNVAQQLGYDKKTLNAITSGSALGTDFAGVIFSIIYILATIGLTVYIKYYYFVRAIVFTILIAIGPVFMALWAFPGYGKGRFLAWIKDFLGTVFVQSIHALVLTFMALFMSWNNSVITSGAAKRIVAQQNYAKQNPITSLFYNPSDISLSASAKIFEGMVAGFIVLIVFQPLSKSLAELFGISTNMLDNIHHSTSRTLKAGALLGGGALVAGATAPLRLGGAVAKGALGATKDSLKAAKKAGKLGYKNNLKNFGKGFGKSYSQRKPLRSSLAKINGIVGPGTGRLIGMAAGAGAGDPETMLAMSKAGGLIGQRAARLANKPLSYMGLGTVKDAVKGFVTPIDQSKNGKLVNEANRETQKGLNDQAKAVRDANNGQESMPEALKAKMKAATEAYNNGEISKLERDQTIASLKGQMAEAQEAQKIIDNPDIQNKMALANARKKENGAYSNVEDLNTATRKALGNYKLNGVSEADGVQESFALAGAATRGAVKSAIGLDEMNDVTAQAKAAYEKTHGNDFAKNGFANKADWMASNQYRHGESTAIKQARQAYATMSNGKIISMPDQTNNDAFGKSLVNKDTYKQELGKRMAAANVPESVQERVNSAIDGVAGESFVSTTPIPGSENGLKTINTRVNNKLAAQEAFTHNNAANNDGNIVNSYDLAQVYGQDNNPNTLIGKSASEDFTANGFKDYLASSNTAQRYQAIGNGLADAYSQAQHDQANLNDTFDNSARGSDLLNIGNLLGGGYGGGVGFQNQSSNDYVAATRIANFNNAVRPAGMNPEEAINALTSNASIGDGSGIPAGDLQLVTNNGTSYVRGKLSDGNYHIIGKYGEGEPSLAGGETIIQNLDVSPDRTIGPRYDENTHRFETPYSQVGDIKVPRAYSGNGPDLANMLSGYAVSSPTNAVDMSDYHTMTSAPELEQSNSMGSRLTLDQLGDNYTDYKYYSDGTSGVIVGKDKRDGVYKQLTADDYPSLVPQAQQDMQYSIPLMDSGNGLIPDINGKPEIYHKKPMDASFERETMESLKQRMDTTDERQEMNRSLNEMLRPTVPNIRNLKDNNYAYQSLNGLKALHDFE